jgi:asparagine synthase (glutamine-hydrolysing)
VNIRVHWRLKFFLLNSVDCFMSGIGGLIDFNNGPINARALAKLSDELIPRGPDSGRYLIQDSVGFCFRAFPTDRESRLEIQPFVSPHGRILAWDGRLDNRDDLLSHFPHGLNGNTTDVALVMASYLEWGEDFLRRIIGDFALSLWTPATKTLLLARDPFGVRPLYYYAYNSGLIWSSTLEALIRSSGVEFEVDDEFVAGYLAIHPELFRTPYRKVFSVEPGFVVSVHEGHARTRRFWRPDTEKEIRYLRDEEYADHFRQLFREAVQCRLRADGPVWAELSGGLDSSSIVCMADRLMAEESHQAKRLKTISYLDDGETSYDRRFIETVEEKRGEAGYHFLRKGHWVQLASPVDEFIERPCASLCVYGAQAQVGRAMNAEGARILFSGFGGDQLLWSAPEPAAQIGDLIYQLKPLRLHKQLQEWSRVLHRTYWDLLWQEGLVPFLPVTIRARLQNQFPIPAWVNRDFAKKNDFLARLLRPADPFGCRLPSRQAQASSLMFAISALMWGHREPHSYVKTFPFLHRPLVEFVMAVPLEQKLQPTETRPLLRRALKDILPEAVLRRKSKGSVSETLCRGLAREWTAIKAMLDDARVVGRGYIDYKELMSALDKARHGIELELDAFSKVVALEIWLRSIEHHC